MQFEHIDDAHGDVPIKRLTRPTIKQDHLAALRQLRSAQFALDLILSGAIEDGRCDVDPLRNVFSNRPNGRFTGSIELSRNRFVIEGFLQTIAESLNTAMLLVEIAHHLTQTECGPTQMRFENLANIHT